MKKRFTEFAKWYNEPPYIGFSNKQIFWLPFIGLVMFLVKWYSMTH